MRLHLEKFIKTDINSAAKPSLGANKLPPTPRAAGDRSRRFIAFNQGARAPASERAKMAIFFRNTHRHTHIHGRTHRQSTTERSKARGIRSPSQSHLIEPEGNRASTSSQAIRQVSGWRAYTRESLSLSLCSSLSRLVGWATSRKPAVYEFRAGDRLYTQRRASV